MRHSLHFAFLFVSVLAGAAAYATSLTPPPGYVPVRTPPTYRVRVSKGDAVSVLLVQTSLPWESTADTDVLDQIGFAHDVADMPAVVTMGVAGLLQYDIVLIANDQVQEFYDLYAQSVDLFDEYVQQGGSLVFFAASNGWALGQLNAPLPGNVVVVPYVGVGNGYAYYNYIADLSDPVVAAALSDGIPLSNDDLYSTACSHGWFAESSLPANTKVVFREADRGHPTAIRYRLGSGFVFASTNTWEYHAGSGPGNPLPDNPRAVYSEKALDDVFRSAIQTVSTVFQMVYPANGSQITVGSIVNIQWTYPEAEPEGDATLYWQASPTGDWVPLVRTRLTASSYEWWVPALAAGTSYRIKVRADDGTKEAVSDPFAVVSDPHLGHREILFRTRTYEKGRFKRDLIISGTDQVDVTNDAVSECSNAVPMDQGVGRIFELNVPLIAGICVPHDLSPGDLLQLGYPTSANTDWNISGSPKTVYVPRYLPDSANPWYFEHHIYSDWDSGNGYPMFSVIRYPFSGRIHPDRQPIVFVHGINGEQGYWNVGNGLPEAMIDLDPLKYEVWEISYPPFAGIRKSAYVVYQSLQRIRQLRGGGTLHVVTHSMGGLVVRAIMEGLSYSGYEAVDSTALIDKVVFLAPPFHGSHMLNVLREENGCRKTVDSINFFFIRIPGSSDAVRDLSMGSDFTFQLNDSQRLQLVACESTLTIVGTHSLLSGTVGASCGESDGVQGLGSIDDTVVDGASANPNQNYFGDAAVDYPTKWLNSWHLDFNGPVGGVGNAEIRNLPREIDSFFSASTLCSGTLPGFPQTQGIPILVSPCDRRFFALEVDGRSLRLFRNTETGFSYLWDSNDHTDLPPGEYTLTAYDTEFAWTTHKDGVRLEPVTISGGGRTTFMTVPSGRLAARVTEAAAFVVPPSHEVVFRIINITQGGAATLSLVDPNGRNLSRSRNDFQDGSAAVEGDINGDGLEDIGLYLESPVSGPYALFWTSRAGSDAELFSVQMSVDGHEIEALPPTHVYQSPWGTLTIMVDLDTPPAISDVTATKGAEDYIVELTWSPPAIDNADKIHYELAYSDSTIIDDAAFDAAEHLDIRPWDVMGGAVRYIAVVPKAGHSYYFALRTTGPTGARARSNVVQATSGPFGPGMSSDVLPPTTPEVEMESVSKPNDGTVTCSWSAHDSQSGIATFIYAIGTHPGASDIVEWTDSQGSTYATESGPTITGARSYYCTVVAVDASDLRSLPGYSREMRVTDAGCASDAYEPDDTPLQASTILIGTPQGRNFCESPDWVGFQAEAGSHLVVRAVASEPLAKPAFEIFDGSVSASVAVGTPVAGGAHALVTPPAAGTHYLKLTSADDAYGLMRSYALSVTPDAAPTIGLLDPPANALASCPTPIRAVASDDDGVTRVEFLVDGILQATVDVQPFTWIWDPTGSQLGHHLITVRAIDTSGQATEASRTVRVPLDDFEATDFSVEGFSRDRIDGRDLFIFAASFGACPGDASYNCTVNIDRLVDPSGACIYGSDFHLFMEQFGRSR